MSGPSKKRGRPNRHRQFDRLLASCPPEMRRPKYVDRIGVRRGRKGDTIWLKIQLPKGGFWRGRAFPPGSALEVKLGWKSSISWDEAIARRDDLQGRADRGETLEDSPAPIFGRVAQDWLERKQGTVADFTTLRGHVEKHLNPVFGAKPLSGITRRMVERWITLEREKGYAPGYVKRMLNTLRAILNDAVSAGEIDTNPASGIVVKGTVARQRYLNGEEVIRLLAAAERVEPWLSDVILWALHSGMRRGEIQNLNWSDIRDLPEGGKVVLLQTSKSGEPRRVICTGAMLEILERQAERCVEGGDRVFPVSKMTWRRRWEKARASAGLEDIDFHDLRRTNATMAAVSGVDIRTLAARIGHTDLSMLEKHYAMVVGSAEHEAAKKIQDTFDRLGKKAAPSPQ